MKCINKKTTVLVTVLLLAVLVSGCGSASLVKPYEETRGSMWQAQSSSARLTGLAEGLCVSNEDVIPEGYAQMAGAAGLFDLSNEKVLYGYKLHEKMFPASLTKIMTALLVLEYYQGDFTDTVVVSENASVKESGAQVCGYRKGDTVSVDQLLHGLLIYSGNDAAMILAEYIGGSVDNFVNIMNMRAVQLGATNTHFVNPHGLHDEEHYTTAYDLYIIFQKVMQFDKFREIINKTQYDGEYLLSDGSSKKVSWKSTNQFFTGDHPVPEGVTMIGGKTGTTNAAGACLILLSQNAGGANYISVVLQAEDKDALYVNMTSLLKGITGGLP